MVKSSPTLGDLPEITGADTTEASSSADAEFILINDENVIRDTVDSEPQEAKASVTDQETKPVTFIDTIPIIMNVDDTNTPCMIENKNLLINDANQIILGSVKITITTNGGQVTKVSESSEDGAERSVPGGIGGNVFFGKAVSGSSEMYNVGENDFYNQIFQTMNNDVFVVGRFAKVADTAHNRMVLAKFDKEETNSGDATTGKYYKY
ncbi:hypothetical protein DCAR_0209119 [Daucus carota subsp. sativus]|uniref:Uncharacterized protein n=2 Tax=Daucus carota subsp. sativus TaxID=79200 RepID=A0A166F1U8_DAUCS|nr:hypothetical protein DCAR_0209119 [Daucus carota subsp. sativus]